MPNYSDAEVRGMYNDPEMRSSNDILRRGPPSRQLISRLERFVNFLSGDSYRKGDELYQKTLEEVQRRDAPQPVSPPPVDKGTPHHYTRRGNPSHRPNSQSKKAEPNWGEEQQKAQEWAKKEQQEAQEWAEEEQRKYQHRQDNTYHSSSEQSGKGNTTKDAKPEKDLTKYWEILGVAPGSSENTVKSAFRKKARKCHPDMGGTKEEFQKLNAAYEEYLRSNGLK